MCCKHYHIHGNAVIDFARRVVAGREKHRVPQQHTIKHLLPVSFVQHDSETIDGTLQQVPSIQSIRFRGTKVTDSHF